MMYRLGSGRHKVDDHIRVEHQHAVEIRRPHLDHAQVEGRRVAGFTASRTTTSERVERKRNARAARETREERETRLERRLDLDQVEIDRRLKQHRSAEFEAGTASKKEINEA